tara:strand:- start:496 stop:1437 length:942 start_codon:yes stop_codon:yes gene_type:complete
MTSSSNFSKYLAAENERLCQNLTSPKHPVCFVIGLPRVASTLLVQCLVSVFEIGYVSNITARFPDAPYIGARLSRELAEHGYVSNFRSSFGNTSGAEEPHEWGWFWQSVLGLNKDSHYSDSGEEIDIDRVGCMIAALEDIYQAPCIFDNVFAMANIVSLKKKLKSIVVIDLTRDPFYVCSSILNARRERFGNYSEFYGHRPKNINEILKCINPVEQVVLQVRSIVQEIEEAKSFFATEEVISIDYDELVLNPAVAIEAIESFFSNLGVPLVRKSNSANFTFENRNDPKFVKEDIRSELDLYYARHFSDMPRSR